MGTRTESRLSDLVNGHLSPEEALRVLEEAERNPEVSRDLDLQVELLNLAGSTFGNLSSGEMESGSARWTFLDSLAGRVGLLVVGRRLAPLVLVGVCLLAGAGLLIVRSVAAGPYAAIAEIREPEIPIRVRAESGADLVAAAEYFSVREYIPAAERLERFLRMYPESESAPWVEYAAGVARLAGARKSTWIVLTCFDELQVEAGLRHLSSVLGRNDSPVLRSDALWYQAKGFLMVGRVEEARRSLQAITAQEGTRSGAAQQMLAELDDIHPR
jgi:hypothetical protein